MSSEDEPYQLTWEVQLHESVSRVWICKAYGRTTTDAACADIARAVLAGYLAAKQPRPGDVLRAIARPDNGDAVTVTTDQLPSDAWTSDPAALEALPVYLRQALP
ncbi:hypothetical protein [Streptomyces sp. NPDC005573]|uniref:hypothetical protein n=1 Tax=unclassified Streptomyces TaxID=2593676 RepID=UPI0033A2961B